MSVQMKISEMARMLRAGEVSARELTQAFINDIDSTDEKIGAYLTRTDEIALKTAHELRLQNAGQLRAALRRACD